MFTKWNNTNWSVTGEKRFLFMAPGPEGPTALDEAQLASSTIAERAEALTLDDSENPTEANADHPQVVEYLDDVENKLDNIRSQHNIGEITELKSRLHSQCSANDALTSVFRENFEDLNDEALVNNNLLKLVQDYPSIRSVLEGPEPTQQAINNAFSSEEVRLTAEIAKTEAELTAATETENAAKAVKEQLQTLAIDTIKEKQERRFKEAKIDFSANKIAALFNDMEDPNHDQKCLLAGQFLSGLLSNAELKLKPDDATAEFERCMKRTSDDAIKQYVDKLISGTEGNNAVNDEMKNVFGDKHGEVPADVRAYVHGLIASTRGENGKREPDSEDRDWINQRLEGLEPMNVENVEKALADYHTPGIQDLEDTVDNNQSYLLVKINENPEAQSIYRQRMAEAMRELPNDKQNDYLAYFLAQVARMGADDINKIRAIPSPDLWANRADTLNALPKGSRPAKTLPAAVVNVATRMAQRCRASGAEEGQVYAFTHGEKIYYAVYGGGGNVTIHDVPGGADMSSEMPPDDVSGDRSVGAAPNTGTARQEKRSGAGEKTGESLTENEGVAQFKQQLLSRMSALRQEVKDGKVNDVGTLAIHLDTALRAAASGIKNLTTMVIVGGQPFNITVPESGSPMVSGDANAAAIVIFNSTPRTAVSTETPQSPENLRNSARGTVRSILGIKQSVGEMQAQINSSLTTAQKSALTTGDNGVRQVFQQKRIVAGGTLTLTAQINTNNQVFVTSRAATPEETTRYDNAVKAKQAKRASASA